MMRYFEMTRKPLFTTLTIFLAASAFSFAEKSPVVGGQTKLTILQRERQDSGFEGSVDTLMKAQTVDLGKNTIDVYFCYRKIGFHYYLPTKSIYRTIQKDKECNWKIYPNNVRCYEYDHKKRVIQMQVDGSGTMGHHTYGYDDQDRIVEMRSNSDDYKMTYGPDGNLLRMTVDGVGVLKELTFIYETK